MPRIELWRGTGAWMLERRLARATGRFVAPHEAVRNWCVARGLPPQRMVVIPGGVPPAQASDVSRSELLGQLSLPTDARLVGVVGRLVHENRVKDLIWAADLLRVLHDNLRLLVIGDGPHRQSLEQFARLASDLEHVRFLGARHDLWRILPHLDVLWDGSERPGQAMAVREAMAAGVPVVATDVPGHRELIRHDQSGYLAPIAGRAARSRVTDRLLSDTNLAARVGGAGRQHVLEHFDIGQYVDRHLEMYHGLSP